MAILEQWTFFEAPNNEYCMGGLVYDDKRYFPGQRLVTDVIQSINDHLMITTSGETFNLGQPHPLFAEQFPELFTSTLTLRPHKVSFQPTE